MVCRWTCIADDIDKVLDKLNKFIKENNLEKGDIIDITINQVEVNEYDSDKISIRLLYWKDRGVI